MKNMDEMILCNMYRYKRISEKKLDEVLKKYNLKKIDLDILVFLKGSKKKDTAKDIAETEMFTKGHISQSVKHMKDLGFIDVESDKWDLRVKHLKLNKKSKKVLSEMSVIKRNMEKRIFDGITDEEKDVLEKVMDKIYANITDIIALDKNE